MLHLKYAPKTITDCVVNLNIIKELPKYLKSKDTNTVCIINGNSGSGKTLTTNLILKHLQLKAIEINFTEKVNRCYINEKIEISTKGVIIFEDSQNYMNDLNKVLLQYFKNHPNSSKKIIIILDTEIPKLKNINYINLTSQITNVNLYHKFIKKIIKEEKIKIKNITDFILKFDNNLRLCITTLENGLSDNTSMFTNNNIEYIYTKILEKIDLKEKEKLIHHNNINVQFMYYENVHKYDMDIEKRLKFSEAMIFCDQFNTRAYNNQNWKYLDYITYVSCIKSSDIIPYLQKITLKKSTIWSSYSN